jgi:hypothetical protein
VIEGALTNRPETRPFRVLSFNRDCDLAAAQPDMQDAAAALNVALFEMN